MLTVTYQATLRIEAADLESLALMRSYVMESAEQAPGPGYAWLTLTDSPEPKEVQA